MKVKKIIRCSSLQDLIAKNIESDPDSLIVDFCQGIMELYPLQGSAIALQHGTKFKLHHKRNIFTDNHDLEFDYTDADVVAFSKKEKNNKNELFLIPDPDRTILLIIAPFKKNRIHIPEIQDATNLLARVLEK